MVKLNLGAGLKVHGNFINIDKETDLEKPLPWKENEVEEILLEHVLEHITNDIGLLEECWRILKPNGKITIISPHTSNIHSNGTITHKRTGYHYHSFEIFEEWHIRNYYTKARFHAEKRKIKTFIAWQWLANWKPSEYEKYLSHVFPAREIKIEMRAIK